MLMALHMYYSIGNRLADLSVCTGIIPEIMLCERTNNEKKKKTEKNCKIAVMQTGP